MIDHHSGLANHRSGFTNSGRGNPRGGHGGGRGDNGGRVVQIGAVTTIPDHDHSMLTNSNGNQGGGVPTPSGNAGARFGGQHYRQAGTTPGRE